MATTNRTSTSKPPLPPSWIQEASRPSEIQKVPSANPNPASSLIHTIQFPVDHIIKDPPSDNHKKLIAYMRSQSHHRRLRHCRRCICASICIAALVIIVVGLISCFIFRPKALICTVSSLSIAGFDPLLSSPFTIPLDIYINMIVSTKNPNKRLSLLYQTGGTVSVSFDKANLCNGDWPAFIQPPGNVTELQLDLKGSEISLTGPTRDAILNGESKSMVPLTVAVKVHVKIKYGFVKSWNITVTVSCDIVVDALNAAATIVSNKCRVNTNYLW